MSEDRSSDNFVRTHPSDQNAVDIFRGEWSSKFPEEFQISTTGQADLFEDQRITWAQENGIEFQGKRVLELGPLEAGHTWMMDQRGTSEILAIEAHERAYLKCLIIRELTQMKSARFLHGNFEQYLESNQEKYDICLVSGVLYHSTRPVMLLQNICRACNQIILWTHYYDETVITNEAPALSSRFKETEKFDYQGISINLHPFQYLDEASTDAFCGGLNTSSIWLERNGIETILEKNGFKIAAEGFDHPHHPNGPSYALIAEKK